MYSRAGILWLFTTLSTRTQSTPTKEQKNMCHTVKAIGKGKSLYASNHLLKRMTAHDMPIHVIT